MFNTEILRQDYFTAFGLPLSFTMDIAALTSAYFSLQRGYHPDKVAHLSPEEKLFAAQISSHLNAGYHTLKNPLKRAEYLLSLQGIRVNCEQATQSPSQTILMEAMEHREALADATTRDAVEYLQAFAKKQVTSGEAQLAQAFADGHLAMAADRAIYMQYAQKFLQDVEQKLAGMAQ